MSTNGVKGDGKCKLMILKIQVAHCSDYMTLLLIIGFKPRPTYIFKKATTVPFRSNRPINYHLVFNDEHLIT